MPPSLFFPDETFPLHLFLEECDDNDDAKAEAGQEERGEGANKREVASQDCGDEANDGFYS